MVKKGVANVRHSTQFIIIASNRLNFISVLNRATDEEISQAIDVMENSSGQHKGRITACKRELRKRMKERNK